MMGKTSGLGSTKSRAEPAAQKLSASRLTATASALSEVRMSSPIHPEVWPPLPLDEWKPTRDMLHMWTQMVGKLRLRLAPPVNHWWHTPLYVSPRGLTTGAMPYKDAVIAATFDFLSHELVFDCNDNHQERIGLYPR